MTDEKKITVMEMFPEKADFDELMDAFDKYQQEADGRDIKTLCEKNKEHITSLGVNAEFLPFFLMKKLIDRAIDQVAVKNEAVEQVEEMVKNLDGGVEEEKENFEKEEVNNIPPINNDAEDKKEEVQGETATGGSITEAESDPEANNSC
tara:strand:- start:37 stop:483 length:447 start_codon:yes stop_codon:yes gene_type:complete